MRKTLLVGFERVHSVLLSLGYRHMKENHYRRGRFHVITHPKKGRVELHIHVDGREYGPPLFQHRSRKTGKDISREYESIKRGCRR